MNISGLKEKKERVDIVEPFELSLSEASRSIWEKKLSPAKLADSLLKRIDKLEPVIHAWVTLDAEAVIRAAEARSKEAEEGKLRGPLHGIPIGIKDIYLTEGVRTTAGSKLMSGFIPQQDATAVSRLKNEGAIILGKTETTEYAYTDPAPTRNPWNPKHTPGGSSSGSAAAVSAGMCPGALGSQTGGSTIRPAAYCGIVGLKPTYGRISRYGMFPLAWTLDHVGILTRNVRDAALLLEVISGRDSKDPTSSTLSFPSYSAKVNDTSPPKLGVLKGFFYDYASESVKKSMNETVKRLESAGAETTEVRPPRILDLVLPSHRIIMSTEAASVHEEDFNRNPEDFRPKIRGLIASGLLTPASTYLKAQRIRTIFVKEVSQIIEPYDCLIIPSTPATAPRGLANTGDASFNSPWSLCGLPTISIPSGLTKRRLPLGLQIIGKSYDEETLLQTSQWCEKVLSFDSRPHNPVA